MKKSDFKRTMLLTVATTLACQLWAQMPKALEVKELRLSNGMAVWLNEDHSQPKVYGAVVVQAGAKDCPNTGIAHYFEHIMFKGTEEIGTVDYQKEKPWLDSIAAAYDRLAATNDETQRTEIQKDINRLSQHAAEYAIPNEFNSLISRYGGSKLNAGTSFDFTFYHNTFTPQYLEHWCQLNSDRLINPVFRLFQGELETVYEEKNREQDNISKGMAETMLADLFGTNPYAYPVIGSTENLKNPKLSDMKKFYEQYYVGCNMGLVLSGDIQADNIMPLLERTFGRIPQGVKPKRVLSPMPDIVQERTVEVKLPIPLVSMEMLAFKAPTEYEKDANALKMACSLLSNGKAGMLDSLMTDGRFLVADISPMSLNDAGIVMLILVPNLLAKSAKAEALCLQQMKRIADGDFSEQTLAHLKQEAKREALRELETIDDRAMSMVMVMSSGHRWQEYLDNVSAIDNVTKEDVQAAAKRYLNAPFARYKKKFGTTKKDKLNQPGYTPVKPKNVGKSSDYAQRMKEMPVQDVQMKLIDFDHDATMTQLGQQARLYTVKNPVNDMFQLTAKYNKGREAEPELEATAILMNNIGTSQLTRQQLGTKLQELGADLSFDVSDNNFSITVTGVDKNFEQTMQVVNDFLKNAKSDKKSMDKVKDGVKASEKALAEENTDVMEAMIMKMLYGDKSPMLNRLTSKEVKEMTGEELIEEFQEIFEHDCTIDYSGTLPHDRVEAVVRKTFPVDQSKKPYEDYDQDPKGYDQPMVYIFNKKDTRQTLFITYEQLKPTPNEQSRATANVFSQYFGGGMSSVLFQEIREFRSMAYSTQSLLYKRSIKRYPESPMAFLTITGTQGDKAMSGIALVDSLLHDMPCVEKNFETNRQEMINKMSNNYPSFRDIAQSIDKQRKNGYVCDQDTGWDKIYEQTTLDDMKRFFNENIKNNDRHRVFAIIGNKKKLNLKELQKYGRVVFLKEKDLFKK